MAIFNHVFNFQYVKKKAQQYPFRHNLWVFFQNSYHRYAATITIAEILVYMWYFMCTKSLLD